jgi:hypothetical protein
MTARDRTSGEGVTSAGAAAGGGATGGGAGRGGGDEADSDQGNKRRSGRRTDARRDVVGLPVEHKAFGSLDFDLESLGITAFTVKLVPEAHGLRVLASGGDIGIRLDISRWDGSVRQLEEDVLERYVQGPL